MVQKKIIFDASFGLVEQYCCEVLQGLKKFRFCTLLKQVAMLAEEAEIPKKSCV